MSAFSVAVIEAVEEAIYNSLIAAETTVGRDGHTRHALPHGEVVALLAGRTPPAPQRPGGS